MAMGDESPKGSKPRRPWLSGLFLLALSICCVTGSAFAQQASATGAVPASVAPIVPTTDPTSAQIGAQTAAQPPAAALGQVHGTVIDADGDVVEDAEVTLTREAVADSRKTKTDADGRFQFDGVPPGKFRVTASSAGLSPRSFSGQLQPGEQFETPAIRLDVATVDSSVDVTVSQQELAQAEMKVEEHQRLGGVVPNFFVTYDWNAAPLSTKQKFELSWRTAIDPANFVISAATAGVQQANNSLKGFGQGAAGYGKRFGADTGDLLIGSMLGGAVFPALLHQDPRYFYKGTGSVTSRALYALSTAFICRGDNGKWQPNYSSVLGDLSAGGLSNLYYPSSDRNGAALTFENGLIDIASDAVSNLVQEFIFRHLTPHAPTYAPMAHP
jgi:hypothetical protein